MSLKARREKKVTAKVAARRKINSALPESSEGLQPPKIFVDFKTDATYIGACLALASIYFVPVLSAGNSQVLSAAGTDVWNQYFFWRHFGFSALARGELPLWNPYIFSGTPYVAGIQSAIFYPLNVIHLLFDTPLAINLGIALHCFLASLFTYIFSRYLNQTPAAAFLSAITFAYGAPYFLHIYAGHLSNLATMAWLPLVFLGVEAFLRERNIKYALLGGIPLSMQVVAGHPQYFFYSVIAAGLYFVLSLLMAKEHSRLLFSVGGFCLLIISGFALAAIQVFPTVELARHSVREALTYEWVSVFSFPPENLITLLLPDFFGDVVTVPYWGKNYLWEMSVYVGVVPLVCAAIAITFDRSRQVKVFALLALLALLLAFGKHTPLLSFLYAYVPGFNLFRGLSKFVFVFAFAVSVLAGYGLSWLSASYSEGKNQGGKVAYFIIGVGAALLLAGIGVHSLGQVGWRSMIEIVQSSQDRFSPIPPISEKFVVDTMNSAFWSGFKTSIFLFAFGALLLLLKKWTALTLHWFHFAIIGLAVIDLWLFGFRYLPSFSPASLSLDPQLKAFLERDKEPYRVGTPIFALLNVGLAENIENVGGYDAILLKRYNGFINFSQNIPNDEPNIVMAINRFSPLLRLLNLKYYILEASARVENAGLRQVFESERYRVYQDSKALPRSFIVHAARLIKEENAALQALLDPRFDPAAIAIVDETVEGLPNDLGLQSPSPRVVARSLNEVVIDAHLNAAGLLILADTYYPGWKAFVDGKESQIYRVNHIMRGVLLPAGRYRVEFRYAPLSFRLGVLVSVVSLVSLVAYFIWGRAKSERHGVTR